VPLIVTLGSLSGYLSNSGFSNPWFDAVQKPSFMPPGWVFGATWAILYALMGVAVAMVLDRSWQHAASSRAPALLSRSWRSTTPGHPSSSARERSTGLF
jgi:tryptophan-rich sensory protein